MSGSALTTSTLSLLTRSFKPSRQLTAVPGETGGGDSEPEDDTRPLTDTTTRHSIRRVSNGSRNSHVAYQERQRHHERGLSVGRRRAKRSAQPPDVDVMDSEAIAVVQPQVLAVLEQHMMEASYAVQISVSEATALQAWPIAIHKSRH